MREPLCVIPHVIYRLEKGTRIFFMGGFEHDSMTKKVYPRETRNIDRAKHFQSAAHGYKFGDDHRVLSTWRVGRV